MGPLSLPNYASQGSLRCSMVTKELYRYALPRRRPNKLVDRWCVGRPTTRCAPSTNDGRNKEQQRCVLKTRQVVTKSPEFPADTVVYLTKRK